jgi:PAS domain S-box-containing protein
VRLSILRSSLRTRLALWITLTATLLTFIGVGVGFWSGYTYLLRNHEQNIRSHMRLAATALAPSVLNIDYLGLRDQIALVMQYKGIEGVRIVDQNDHVLMEQGRTTQSMLSEPIAREGHPMGAIQVSFSNAPIVSGIVHLLTVGTALFICFVPLFAYLVWRISGVHLTDLSRLTARIQSDPGHELRSYPGEGRNDEIGVLAAALHHRDHELAASHTALEQYQRDLEQLVQQRTRQLRHSEMLGQTILGSIPEAIALVDVNELKILDVNAAFCDFFGQSKTELITSDFAAVIGSIAPDTDASATYCQLRSYFEQQLPCRLEREFTRHSGEKVHLETSAWPVRMEDAELTRMVYVQRDVTEQKRLENLRADVERIVRHDLKTPLSGIIGLALLLLDEEKLESELCEYVEHIHDSGLRMLEMINNSMDLFKMEEGSYVLRPLPFNLTDTLHALDKETGPIRRQREVTVAYHLNSRPLDWEQPLHLNGNQANIHSMLSNLLNNALEAAPRGSRVTLDLIHGKDQWVVDIHNQGAIPQDIRESFFERYVTAGKPQGTGLGTYSARLIARTHGGDITFTTSAKEGTHVLVSLPMNPASSLFPDSKPAISA